MQQRGGTHQDAHAPLLADRDEVLVRPRHRAGVRRRSLAKYALPGHDRPSPSPPGSLLMKHGLFELVEWLRR